MPCQSVTYDVAGWGTWPLCLSHWRPPGALLCCKHVAKATFYLHLTCRWQGFWSDKCLPPCQWSSINAHIVVVTRPSYYSLALFERGPEFLNGRSDKNWLKHPEAIHAESLLWNRITGKLCNKSNGEWWSKRKSRKGHRGVYHSFHEVFQKGSSMVTW